MTFWRSRYAVQALLLLGALGLLGGRAQAQGTPNANSKIGTNLSAIRDFSSEYSFIDAFKSSRMWATICSPSASPSCTDGISYDTGEQALLDLDPNGWVRSLPGPASPAIYRGVGTLLMDGYGHYPAGQYIVLYDGEGTVNYAFDATRDPLLSSPGRDVINVLPSVNGIWLTITATDPNRTGNYIRNIRVIMPGFEQTYGTQIFHPDFLSKIERYRVLRFLDWMETDASTQRDWANRPQLSEARWSTGRGVPAERMIQLANRISADPWFTIPHMATDDYVKQLALLVLANLDSRRTIYVEYSNEIWNTLYPFSVQGDWIQQQANAMWPDPAIDPVTKRLNWAGMRAAQVCDIWRTNFGAQAGRVNCVISGSVTDTYTQSTQLDCPLWTAGAPCSGHGIRSLAVGAYCTLDPNNPSSNRADIRTWLSDADGGLTRLFNELFTGGVLTAGYPTGELQQLLDQLDASAGVAAARGLTFLAYEGGQSLYDNNREPAIASLFAAANRDPRMGTLYDQLLLGWRNRSTGMFNHLNSTSTYGTSGAWGALEFLDLTGSPKYDALMRYAGNPTPALVSISPSAATAGGRDLTLTIAGSNFVNGSIVTFNGATLTTAYISGTQLTSVVPAAFISIGGTYNVTVKNPLPGGGTTGALPFTVNNPLPNLGSLAPSSGIVGGPTFTLTLNGSGFVSTSQASFNGATLSTTYVSPSQVTAVVPATFISATGSYNVTLTSPAPGGGTTGVLAFSVNYPAPVLSAVSPSETIAGGPDLTVTLIGSAFSAVSQVTFAGSNVASALVSATQLSATIPAFLLASSGTFNLSVTNSAPGGGTATLPFKVSNPLPVLSAMTPLTANTGDPGFTISMTGSAFATGAQVTFNGAVVPTTVYSPTSLDASIPAAFVSVNGTYNVAVVNPAPGGGSSRSLVFTVQNPAPIIASISPSIVLAGGPAFTLTANGFSFVNGSQITLNGAVLATTFVASTQLSAAVPASMISVTGNYNVTVVSSAPGGGTTAPQTFSVANPAPRLVSLSPSSASVGGPGFTLTINGTGFVNGSQVSYGGTGVTTTFVSATQLSAAIPAASIAAVGSYDVTVLSPAPGGGGTGAISFIVSNPLPAIGSITPAAVSAGGPDFTLTIAGVGFSGGSQVNINGAAAATTFVSATQLTATIPAASTAAAGTLNVTVTTPVPGGGTSAPRALAVNNPSPAITALTPSNAGAGGPGFTMTIDGASFVASSQVAFNGISIPTSFVSQAQLTAFVPASSIGAGGAYNVIVTNPPPVGGVAPARVFAVNNPLPALTAISPAAALVGGSGFTLTLGGASFVNGAQATFNGANVTTTFVSGTQLTAAIPAAFISATGTYAVTANNPLPGGGASAAQAFTVNSPAPVLASISPSGAAPGGAAFTLTVTGSSFFNGAQVSFGATSVPTTFVSATQLLAAIPASAIVAAGTFSVTVMNAPPGGGTSGAQPFTVSNPVPVLSALAPASVIVAGFPFTLTISGSSFVNGSQVSFNGASVNTTFVSPTQINADIPASAITVAGMYNITVFTPAPGGGASAPRALSVNNPVPDIYSTAPASANAGGAAFTLTLAGGSFVNGSRVTFNGAGVATTYSSDSQLTAAMPASAIATAGSFTVAVTNPAPGGGSGLTQVFQVNNASPLLGALSPSSTVAGGADFTLTLSGSAFVPGSQAIFDTMALTTTFVSPARLTAVVPAASIAGPGSFNVTISNPAPGGGTSGALSFAITNPGPVITAVAPQSASAAGAAFTLTLTGSSFDSAAQVAFNGANVVTMFVSASQLTAQIPAAAIAAAGSFNVTVANPAPGGGLSAIGFVVNNPGPVLAAIVPSSAAAGAADLALTLNGSAFNAGSQVSFNGSSVATTFVSATQLTATVPSAFISTSGTFGVRVNNPAPGGGTSAAQSFTVTNPGPVLSAISPASLAAGAPAFTLTLLGSSFAGGVQATVNGATLPTTFLSSTQLTASVPASAVATAGAFNVTVRNPLPGGGTSAPQSFTVTNSTPVLLSLSPPSAIAGGAAFTLTVAGSSFVNGSQATFAGSNVPTTYVSATQLTAAIPASAIAGSGNFDVTVVNPAPGGGATMVISFAVTNPGPAIAGLSPPSSIAGGADFTVTINGSSFVAGAQASFNGAPLTTTFVSPVQLTAVVPAFATSTAGSFNVTVANPAPGGGLAVRSFVVNNPAPVLSAISPATANAGSADVLLTLTGSGFGSPSQATFNGASLATNLVSPTQLTAVIPGGMIAASGTYAVLVANPAPGGGASGAQTFTVTNLAPVLSAVAPASAIVGGPSFTLTVIGTGFLNGSQARFNAASVPTAYVSSTQVTAQIPASAIAATGSYNVAVSNPAPGGGASAPLAFAVNNPAPVLNAISPASALAGGVAFTLTLSGTSFMNGSQASFNGAPVTTTFVSATQLTAAIPATAIATAGAFGVLVTSPAPGGGPSAAQTFSANNPAPVLASIAPAIAAAGSADLTVTLTGSGFVNGAQATFNGANVATTFVSATQLTALVTAATITIPGAFSMTVISPEPGGGSSAAQTFTVANALPALTEVFPSTGNAGGGAFTLTLTGSSFVRASQASFNGTAVATTYVSPSQLTAAIPASSIAFAGSFNVTVTSPTPGGGTTAPQRFTVSNPAPVIGGLSPPSVIAGGPSFTLTISGTSFVNGSQATYNGASVPTAFVSATQLTAQIPAAGIATPGAYGVSVTNPAPGGGTSALSSLAVNNALPVLSSISPATATVGSPDITMTLIGSAFMNGSQVSFNGNNVTTTFVSSTQLIASIPSTAFPAAGAYHLIVTNPAPGGGSSLQQNFTVTNPLPVLTSIDPTTATAGDPTITMTLTGSSFVSGAQVSFNGTIVATTVVSSTQLTATIPPSAILSGGTDYVIVVNPGPGGGSSAPQPFVVSNRLPAIASISPSSIGVGSAAFTLTAAGSAFVSGSIVTFNGANVTTTFVSPNQLLAAIPASFVSVYGVYNVGVVNPAPSGGASPTTVPFMVNNPVPILAALSPSSVVVGGPSFVLTLSGSFVRGGQVTFNGSNLATTFVSQSQLTAVVPASFISATGTYNVTVTNPPPAGGTSAPRSFNVANAMPVLSALSPSTAIVGGLPFTLSISGTSFVNGAQATFNGTNVPTTFVSPILVTAAIPTSAIAATGQYNVTVVSPAPGRASAPLAFAVNNPLPSIASLSPSGVLVGGPALTLTLNGAGFVGVTQVTFNGASVAATFVSTTQLTAAIPAAALAIPGVYNVVATNPAPGGGVSAPQSFTVSNPLPVLTSIAPSSALVGGPAFSLTLNGSAFVSGSQVTFNGAAVATTFVSASQLTAAIPPAMISVTGTYGIRVVTAGPGGGTTAPQTFIVNNPAPVLSAISPQTVQVGGPAFTLTLNGSGFVSGSRVTFNGANATAIFVSAAQLTAQIPASFISATGAFNVLVTNATPGGGTSAAVRCTVANPSAVLASIQPSSVPTGSPDLTLTLQGSAFLPGAVATFNGRNMTTTYVSSTEVDAFVPAATLATGTTFNVVVLNPSPVIGPSAAQVFTVVNPAPALYTMSPTNRTAGTGAFTLTVSGAGFVPNSQISFNGTAVTTRFVSAGQLTGPIAASLITIGGNFPVTVISPAPGGGTSGSLTFQVRNPRPNLSSIFPQSGTAGGRDVTIALSGSAFVPVSVVLMDGSPVATSFVSSTQLSAVLPAAGAWQGWHEIRVSSPPPAGGLSGRQYFLFQ